MNNLTDLRQSLENHSQLAPDGVGMVEQARIGAVRIRRNRRIVRSATAFAAVVTVAAGMPLTARLTDPSAHESATTPAGKPVQTSYRKLTERTLSLATGSEYYALTQGTYGNRQFLIARNRTSSSEDHFGGVVSVQDPGTFDPTDLQRGEKIAVNGHPAFLVERALPPRSLPSRPSMPSGPAVPGGQENPPGPDVQALTELRRIKEAADRERKVTTVGWLDPSGAWVVVGPESVKDRADLLHLASAVRVGPPRETRAPFQFGWVPGDLPVTAITNSEDANGHDPRNRLGSHVALGDYVEDPARNTDHLSGVPPWGRQIVVQALTSVGDDLLAEGPTKTIAGRDAWYKDFSTVDDPRTGYEVGIKVAGCVIVVHVVQAEKITLDDVDRMVRDMTFGDCVDPATWKPIMR